jgi:hypothetical protein
MARDTGRDVREEVRVAIFWRALIGDYEYVKYDPEDMLRWYDALDLRGPEEIRVLMNERYATRPVSEVLGIVAKAPHPPTWLVREWLAHHEQKVRTGHLWMATGSFLLASFLIAPFMYGCSALTPVNMYVMNPPTGNTPPAYEPQAPQTANFNPTVNSPPVTTQPGVTTPFSGGIAGSASGVAPPGGMTGPSNVGLSSGAVTSAPAVGSGQP